MSMPATKKVSSLLKTAKKLSSRIRARIKLSRVSSAWQLKLLIPRTLRRDKYNMSLKSLSSRSLPKSNNMSLMWLSPKSPPKSRLMMDSFRFQELIVSVSTKKTRTYHTWKPASLHSRVLHKFWKAFHNRSPIKIPPSSSAGFKV